MSNDEYDDGDLFFPDTKIQIPASFVERTKHGYKFETHFFNNLTTVLRNKLKIGEDLDGIPPNHEEFVDSINSYKDQRKIVLNPMGRFNFGNAYEYELSVGVNKDGTSYIEITPYANYLPIKKKEVIEAINKVQQIKDIIKNTLILMKGGKRRRHTRKQKRRVVKKSRRSKSYRK